MHGFSGYLNWGILSKSSHWHDSVNTVLDSAKFYFPFQVTQQIIIWMVVNIFTGTLSFCNCATPWPMITVSRSTKTYGGEFGRHDIKHRSPISKLSSSFHNWTIMMKLKIPTLALLLRAVSASPYSAFKHKTGRPGIERGSPEFWYHLIVGLFLVLAGGVFAGCVLLKTMFWNFQLICFQFDFGANGSRWAAFASISDIFRGPHTEKKCSERSGRRNFLLVFLFISIVFFYGNSIEAYAEGKTLGLSGTSLLLISFIYLSTFYFKGASTRQCRKYVCFGNPETRTYDYLVDCERKFAYIPGHRSKLEKHSRI